MSITLPFQDKSRKIQPAQLCENCENLKPTTYRSGTYDTYKGRLHCDLNDLNAAVSAGCITCTFVSTALNRIVNASYQSKVDDVVLEVSTVRDAKSLGSIFQKARERSSSIGSVFLSSRSSMVLHVHIADDSRRPNVVNRRSYDIVLQEGSPPLSWIQLRGAKPTAFFGNTGTLEAAQWARARIKHCEMSHEMCGASRPLRSPEKPRLPFRVVEILGDQCIRLRDSIEERADYACLSYRWGGDKSLMTKTDTLHKHLDTIPWDQLPNIFKEAINFTRSLDLRYIWIDSLCIVQDDELDWLRQSGNIHDIFGSSFVTIAATRAAHGASRLFTSSHEMEMTSSEARLLIADQPNHAHPDDTSERSFPLLTRAWAVQELLLAKRVLHFCNGELVYECAQEVICSCCGTENLSRRSYGSKSPVWTSSDRQVSSLVKLTTRLGIPRTGSGQAVQYDALPEESHFGMWRDMLARYLNLGLTLERDRLPAISGLARRFEKRFKATYAAGLWIENLRNELLWTLAEGVRPKHRRLRARAPTWSWASCGSELTSYPCEVGSTLHFSIVAFETIPLSLFDPYGQVKSAALTLKGLLIPLILKRSKSGYDAQCEGRWGIEVKPDLDLSPILDDVNGPSFLEGLAIVRQRKEVRGVVLHRQQDGRYERVGVWYCYSKESEYKQFDPPEYWRAEELDEKFYFAKSETVVIV